MSEDSLLTFPCNLSVKVLGRNAVTFRSAAGEIVRAHHDDLEPSQIAEQLSRNGSFLSLTFTIRAESRDQMDALYRDLTASDDVLLVL